MLVRAALALLVVSCTPSLSSDGRSGAPSLAASASPEPTCLSGPRLNFLANRFFVEYNRRDLEGFLGLFNFSASAGGGGFEAYYDNPGEASTLRDRASLADYLRGRWAMDDRFVSWSRANMPDGLNYPNANPTMIFTRSFGGTDRDGNVKLVCNAGLLVGVVMSSGIP